jgi:hypothetical protein
MIALRLRRRLPPIGMAAAAVLACTTASTPNASTSTNTLRVGRTVRIGAINTMPDVVRWDSSTRGQSNLSRATSLRKSVLEKWIIPYGTIFRVPPDSTLARYIDWLTPRVDRAYRLARDAEIEMQPAANRVATVFPALADTVRLAIIGLSLGNTNGTVRLLERNPILIFGVDVQTVLPDSDIYTRATLEHELVHVAHASVNPTIYGMVEAGLNGVPTPLYVSLFSEGLATWGSARADPTLTPAHYYMDAELAVESRVTCERLAPVLLRELESTDAKRYGDWFFLSGRDSSIPHRYAYVLGERVVRQLARRYSAVQLLQLTSSDILKVTRQTLSDTRSLCA